MSFFLPFGINNENDFNSFEQQTMMEEYKRKFEDLIRRTIYQTLLEFPDDYINGEHIPNKLKNLNELISNFETTEEYEKCSFLSGLKKKIESKETAK